MNRGLWIARTNYLRILIKKVSDAYGGDEDGFFKQHCKEVIESHPDELIEVAIAYYLEIVDKLKYSIESAK